MSNPEEDTFRLRRLPEPNIQFDGGSAVSPKRGLFEYGPRLKNKGHYTISVGGIGDRESLRHLNEFLLDMTTPIHPDLEGEMTRPWRVPFPGVGPESELNISVDFRDRWRLPLRDALLDSIELENTALEKMESFLKQINKDIRILSGDDPSPDVIVVCIPEKIMDECTPEGQEEGNVNPEGHNLHNRVKLLGMEHGLPTQLIKPDTFTVDSKLKKASRAWNITVGLLYKAQRGHPWKTKELEEGTCYAGISFYKDRTADGNVVRAALAHVFARKDYNILQSEPMENLDQDRNGQPHLSAEGAEQISERVIDYYKRRNRGSEPERLVIHKSSTFWDREREGFIEGASTVPIHDFAHISTRRTGLRLFPEGEFPPLRGTLCEVPEDNTYYLYTTGYTPEVATYEGSNIPEPIRIRPDPHSDSDEIKMCKEILFLTKLDWNTSDFSIKEPVTLKVSDKVSSVLSEPEANPEEANKAYYYYM